MCDDHPPAVVSRRALLSTPAVRWAASTRRQLGSPPIIARADWGADLPVRGEIPPEDVRFLLIHHTLEPDSGYEASEVPGLLRSIYQFHTGPEKSWPDIAYNFFVDRFGTIWEGRTGSIASPVEGSATGGNQGFSQLCCFLGDFTTAPPSPQALAAMADLLAWLADRYQLDTAPGAVAEFTSRGSNRWPAGATVSAATIAGHREMSKTECPGNAAFDLVRGEIPEMVRERRTRSTTTTTSSAPPSTEVPSPTSGSVTVPAETTTTPASGPPTSVSSSGVESSRGTPPQDESSGIVTGENAAAASGVALAVLTATLVLVRFRSRRMRE